MAAQDSVLSQIARPYASALFDLAKADNSVAAVEQGLMYTRLGNPIGMAEVDRSATPKQKPEIR